MQGTSAEAVAVAVTLAEPSINNSTVSTAVSLRTLDANVNSIEDILAAMKSDGGVIVLNMLSSEVVAG